MKKLLLILMIGFASIAHAQHSHYNHHNRHHGNHGHSGKGYNWVVPAIIGGIITYEMTRPAPVVVQQPIVIQSSAPYGYRYENILDANCNCYRLVLVQN